MTERGVASPKPHLALPLCFPKAYNQKHSNKLRPIKVHESRADMAKEPLRWQPEIISRMTTEAIVKKLKEPAVTTRRLAM
jgi:hypothetical protein